MKFLLLVLFFLSSLSANNVKILASKYFLDAKHSYTLEDVYEKKDSFSDLAYSSDTFGLRDDILWIYIKVKNTTQENSSNMIEFLFPLHDYLEVVEYSDSKITNQYLTGDLTKFNTRKVDANNFVIPYTLKANETKEFIFKIDSKSTLNAGMQFLSEADYYAKSSDTKLILGGYYGAVLIMLLYNIILYMMIKEKVYIYYVLFHFFYVLAQLSLNGLAFTYLWPNFPVINSFFFPILMILTNLFSIIFSLEFLDIKIHNKKIYNYYKFLMLLHGVLLLILYFLSYSSILKIMLLLSIISIISLFFTGIYIVVKYKTVSSKFFVIAWSSILIGAMLTEFQNIGLLDMSPIVSYGAQIGAFIELTLLSIALAYRYNMVHQKLLYTESNIRKLNTQLQEKVDEQTKDLTLMIKELHHRVKNNFQVILTFLWAQKKSMKDDSSIQALEQTTQRIHAMSSLHELLNISNNSSVDIKTYMKGIVDSFIAQDKSIAYRLNVKEIILTYDDAVTIGLIINELITNSKKYAFESIVQPKIDISFFQKNDTYVLQYNDNGVGCNQEDLDNSTGLGHDLIQSFARKSHANISIDLNHGFNLELSFKQRDSNG